MGCGLGSPPHRAPHTLPIGRPVAGALEPFHIHEAFQQIERMVVKGLPIPANPAGDATQEMTAQVRHFGPRHYEESTVIGNQVEVVGIGLAAGT